MAILVSTVGLLITALVGWSRCGLPPSNDITQNFLWNTGKFVSIVIVISLVSVIAARRDFGHCWHRPNVSLLIQMRSNGESASGNRAPGPKTPGSTRTRVYAVGRYRVSWSYTMESNSRWVVIDSQRGTPRLVDYWCRTRLGFDPVFPEVLYTYFCDGL